MKRAIVLILLFCRAHLNDVFALRTAPVSNVCFVQNEVDLHGAANNPWCKRIELTEDINLSTRVWIASKELIVDGKGHFVHGQKATQCLNITSSSTVALVNVTMRGCSSGGPGGAIYVRDSDLNMRKCEFVDNSSLEDGGAVCAQNGLLSASECSFLQNEARDGGAIFAHNTKVHLTLCDFRSNTPNDITNG